jgi:hypothetical protein
MMYRYDEDTGDYPKLGDRVKTVRSGKDADGIVGIIGGWLNDYGVTALVALEEPMADGRTIVCWPVVCLKKMVSREVEQKSAQFTEPDHHPTKNSIGNLCSESVAIDSDGYTIWGGGDYRPVDKDTIVRVKVRGNIPRDPVRAGAWPQICWMHRNKDDEMNKWDIVAYKVVK